MNGDELDQIRESIDELDETIVKALASRRELAARILEAKNESGLPLRDGGREESILGRLITMGRSLGLDAHFVTRIFHEVIDDSVRSQQMLLLDAGKSSAAQLKRVAFQGIDGAYSQLAAQRFFSARLDRSTFLGYPTFDAALRAAEKGDADYAVLPVENTTAGSINEVYDLLSRSRLFIVGETVFRVDHCLLGLPGATLRGLGSVHSHPQGIAQCMKFLSHVEWTRHYANDTAGAVQKIKEEGDPTQAAIASQEAGELYGLEVLQRNIADQRDNYTRFLVLAREPITVDSRIPCKTSLVMATHHERGALLRPLSVLYNHDLNLTKLESRPRPDTPFQYLFYLDLEGNAANEQVQVALDELKGATSFLKILGSYPAEPRERATPSERALLAAPEEEPAELAVAGSPPSAAPKRKISYKLASREYKEQDTVIEVRGLKIGGPEFVVIAGPCSVESRDQILTCARQVKEAGAQILRGGCFKPRTSPYSFQGLGYEGLDLLVEAGRSYDLPVITEVLSPIDVQAVAETADILQVGARNMQNFSLLNEVGKVNRPVMLKRGMSATVDELLNAAEYILGQGNQQVILCERGIRTFETVTRNTLDLGAIPILKQMTHLPIFVDVSHAAGQRDLVAPLAMAAFGVSPHGLMVEIHPEPEKALSDGPQSLRFPEFTRLMREIRGRRLAIAERRSA